MSKILMPQEVTLDSFARAADLSPVAAFYAKPENWERVRAADSGRDRYGTLNRYAALVRLADQVVEGTVPLERYRAPKADTGLHYGQNIGVFFDLSSPSVLLDYKGNRVVYSPERQVFEPVGRIDRFLQRLFKIPMSDMTNEFLGLTRFDPDRSHPSGRKLVFLVDPASRFTGRDS